MWQGGDAGANASVAGALLGCKLGLDSVPRSWSEPLLHRAWIDDLMDRWDLTLYFIWVCLRQHYKILNGLHYGLVWHNNKIHFQ